MNKIIFAIGLLFVFAVAKAQVVNGYLFSSQKQTYSAVVSANILFNGTWDEGEVRDLPIGFPFFYGGKYYEYFTLSANGAIRLGSGMAFSTKKPMLYSGAISAFGADLVGSDALSNILYKQEGSAPNRKLIVQYSNFSRKGQGDTIGSAQIVLNESGAIEFRYGRFEPEWLSTPIQIGIGGASTLKGVKGNNWVSPTASTLATDTMVIAGTSMPDTGRVYTFTPAGGTVTAPSALTISAVGYTTFHADFTDASTNEVGFALFTSTNKVNYTFVNNVASSTQAGTSTFTVTT